MYYYIENKKREERFTMKKTLILVIGLICAIVLGACSKTDNSESVMTDAIEQTQISSMPSEPEVAVTAANIHIETTTEAATAASVLSGKVICVDAGHGITSDTSQERVSPNSYETKPKYATGTAGSKMTEEQLTLAVSLKLQQELEKKGATVVMSRTQHDINGIDLGNIRRAEIANEANAQATIRIHADGLENPAAHGLTVLVPAGSQLATQAIVEPSLRLGEAIGTACTNATGAYYRGCVERTDLTGFNWSTVPVIFLEMGFMTNPEEDALLSTDDYQNKMVAGIVSGLETYFAS